MIVYFVNKGLLKSQGQYFERGTIVEPDQIKDLHYKVANGDIIRIDMNTAAGLRKIAEFERKTRIKMRAKISQYCAEKVMHENKAVDEIKSNAEKDKVAQALKKVKNIKK